MGEADGILDGMYVGCLEGFAVGESFIVRRFEDNDAKDNTGDDLVGVFTQGHIGT